VLAHLHEGGHLLVEGARVLLVKITADGVLSGLVGHLAAQHHQGLREGGQLVLAHGGALVPQRLLLVALVREVGQVVLVVAQRGCGDGEVARDAAHVGVGLALRGLCVPVRLLGGFRGVVQALQDLGFLLHGGHLGLVHAALGLAELDQQLAQRVQDGAGVEVVVGDRHALDRARPVDVGARRHVRRLLQQSLRLVGAAEAQRLRHGGGGFQGLLDLHERLAAVGGVGGLQHVDGAFQGGHGLGEVGDLDAVLLAAALAFGLHGRLFFGQLLDLLLLRAHLGVGLVAVLGLLGQVGLQPFDLRVERVDGDALVFARVLAEAREGVVGGGLGLAFFDHLVLHFFQQRDDLLDRRNLHGRREAGGAEEAREQQLHRHLFFW